MNSNRDQRWPAREPPSDFVARTVDAMLASARLPRRANRPSRTIAYLVLAALFASGSALAITWHYHRHPVSPPAVASQLAPTRLSPNVVAVAVAAATAAPAPSASVQVTAPKKSAPRSAKTAATNQKPTQPPRRTPACECERGFYILICDCY